MIKTFCDCCGEEISGDNELKGGTIGRLGAKVKAANARTELKVEVITIKGDTANAGDFCLYCVLAALNSADKRARAA